MDGQEMLYPEPAGTLFVKFLVFDVLWGGLEKQSASAGAGGELVGRNKRTSSFVSDSV